MKHWLSLRNMDFFSFHAISQHVVQEAEKTTLVSVFNRETRVVVVQLIFVFVGFQNQ